jgi:hypothetical protein
MKFENELNELASQLGFEIINSFKFQPSFWSDHYITFNYESNGLLYGVTRKEFDPEKKKIEELENLFHGKEKFNTSNWWPLYAFFYMDVDNNAEFYTDIVSGKAIARAKDFFEIILSAKDELPSL